MSRLARQANSRSLALVRPPRSPKFSVRTPSRIPVRPYDAHLGNGNGSGPCQSRLLDLDEARAWFALLRWGAARDLYTYQQPLEGRSGPRVCVRGKPLLMLSSYDYLGLIGHPALEAAAVEAVRTHGTGTGGVRLLTGTTELHRDLERELALFKGTEAALTFSSGYSANMAVIPALFGPRDRALVDANAHRSIIDACLLARVPLRRFRHNDADALRHALEGSAHARRTLVVVEGVYSMDGDVCPFPEIVALKRRYGALLMVDEAHSFGALGARGRGVHEHFGLDAACVDLWTGSLSKAIPANGGFVAGSADLITYLQHAGAPFIFSAALCPAAAGAARAALRVLAAEPDRIERMHQRAEQLREGLRALGHDTGASTTAIVPVIVGSDVKAYTLARRLLDQGLLVTAVVHPAVARGAARLRLCATAGHREQDIVDALDAFRRVGS
jgi:8-amino-7-oxononanoate synthase